MQRNALPFFDRMWNANFFLDRKSLSIKVDGATSDLTAWNNKHRKIYYMKCCFSFCARVRTHTGTRDTETRREAEKKITTHQTKNDTDAAKITCCWPSINQHFKTNTQLKFFLWFYYGCWCLPETTGHKSNITVIFSLLLVSFHSIWFHFVCVVLILCKSFISPHFAMHFGIRAHVCAFWWLSALETATHRERNVMKTCQNQFSPKITEIWMKNLKLQCKETETTEPRTYEK